MFQDYLPHRVVTYHATRLSPTNIYLADIINTKRNQQNMAYVKLYQYISHYSCHAGMNKDST